MKPGKIIFLFVFIIVMGIGGYWLVNESRTQVAQIGDVSPVSENYGDLDTKSTIELKNTSVKIDQSINNQVGNKKNTEKIMSAILHTNKGDITIEFNQATPNTVANFVKLAQAGFYDGTKFHRVMKGFMSQGGDPLSKDDSQIGMWGTGGPGYKFNDEITSSNRNDLGTISMANAGLNTNGSQFFINGGANNFLDTKHTVFGKVVSGIDVATVINNVATGSNDRPVQPVIITKITLKQ